MITPTFSFSSNGKSLFTECGAPSPLPSVASLAFASKWQISQILSSYTNYARSDSPDRRYVGSFHKARPHHPIIFHPPRYVFFLPYGTRTRTTSDLILSNGRYVGILNTCQDRSHHCTNFLIFSKEEYGKNESSLGVFVLICFVKLDKKGQL